jgi:hypothetical protein
MYSLAKVTASLLFAVDENGKNRFIFHFEIWMFYLSSLCLHPLLSLNTGQEPQDAFRMQFSKTFIPLKVQSSEMGPAEIRFFR